MSISQKSAEFAEQLKTTLLGVDPHEVVSEVLARADNDLKAPESMRLMPFVFVQKCDDSVARMSLVMQLDDIGGNGSRTFRYIYHLRTTLDLRAEAKVVPKDQDEFRAELRSAATDLAAWMNRLPPGAAVTPLRTGVIGSYSLVCMRVAGFGSGTAPETWSYRNAEIFEETDSRVVARMKGNMNWAVFLGGLNAGLHVFDRKQVHTLK
jgi:hypothetical protein